MKRLLLIPSPDLGKDADLIPDILRTLKAGGYVLDRSDADTGGENPRVLRTDVAGLPVLALSRGRDEDGSSSLNDAITCISRPLEPDTTLPRLKAAMLAILQSAGPAEPGHPSMLCRTASPWCGFVAQSYTSSSDECDLRLADDVRDMLPPAVILRRNNLRSGGQCLRLAPIYSIARTTEVMDVDAIETLRALKDLALDPLASTGRPA